MWPRSSVTVFLTLSLQRWWRTFQIRSHRRWHAGCSTSGLNLHHPRSGEGGGGVLRHGYESAVSSTEELICEPL